MHLDEIEIGDEELSPVLTSKHSEADTVPVLSARQFHLNQETLLERIEGLRADGRLADVGFTVDMVKRLVVQHVAETLGELSADE